MSATPETSFAAVASRTDVIELSEPLGPLGVVTLGRGFEPADKAWFGKQTRTATVRNYSVEQVEFDTTSNALFSGGKKIKDSFYLVPPSLFEKAGVSDSPIKLEDKRPYIMARQHGNYYHWMTQTLPAVDWSLRNLSGDALTLTCGPLNKWQQEILSLLGHSEVPMISLERHRHYSIPLLEFSEFVNGTTSYAVCKSAHATFSRLVAAALDTQPAVADIVYVARTDTNNRSVVNEREAIALLEQEGVHVVAPGSLSVAQQINLFHKSRAVIGPHGAGLTNAVFCRPMTIFYEMMQADRRNACFNRLAQAAELDYVVDTFETMSNSEDNPHLRTWMIDLDVLASRVREIKDKLCSDHPLPPLTKRQRASAMDYLKGIAPAAPGSDPAVLKKEQDQAIKAQTRHSWWRRYWKAK